MDTSEILVLDGVLADPTEWRNIQEIVRFTFRTMLETVKSQATAIREIERQVNSKANRSELHSSLSEKADKTEVSQHFAELHAQGERGGKFEDLQFILDEKVSIAEFQRYTRASGDELLQKLDKKEWTEESHALDAKLQAIQNEINRKFSGLPTDSEFQSLKSWVFSKADKEDVEAALEDKASKQALAASLQRKANKTDLDRLNDSKLSASEVKGLLGQLEKTLELAFMRDLGTQIERKVELAEFREFIEEVNKKASLAHLDLLKRQLEVLEDKVNESCSASEANLLVCNSEIGHIRKSLSSAVAQKADYSDFEKISSVLSTKIDKSAVLQLAEGLKTDQSTWFSSISEGLQKERQKSSQNLELSLKLERELSEILSQLGTLQTTKGPSQSQDALNSLKTDLSRELRKLRERTEKLEIQLEELDPPALLKTQLLSLCSQLNDIKTTKLDISDLDKSLSSSHSDTSKLIQFHREQLQEELHNNYSLLKQEINAKVSLSELYKALQTKPERTELEHLSSNTPSLRDLTLLRTELKDKPNASALETHIAATRDSLESLSKDLKSKADLKDICALLDLKASTEDTNSALTGIHKELDSKANSSELTTAFLQQQARIEVLSSEAAIGRWLWKSRELKSSLVPWEIQVTNTLPENFIWEPARTQILVVAPGIYEVKLGVYSRKKPTIHLLVNGETALTAVSSPSQVIYSSKTRPHNQLNSTGVTLIDFIVLPSRANISVSCVGDYQAEAFFSLKKIQ